MLEGRRIFFRNFAGEEGRYNNAGQRNFVVFLNEDEAEAMMADGWNVKWLEPKEEGDLSQPILKVKVKFGGKGQPPRVVLITSRGRTNLDESMVSLLDWADIENVDMIIRPYEYDVNGKQGVSAYLKSIYVTIREDALELKYRDVPDSAASAIIAQYEEPEEE